jgi:uncharacterized membrane protein
MKGLSTAQRFALVLAVVLYVSAGVLHFIKTEAYLRIMPPYIPFHAPLVIISGVFEILGGLGLLLPQMRRAAAWGLIALLIAVFPANIYMATSPIEAGAASLAPALLWARLPLQLLLVWWLLWCTRSRSFQYEHTQMRAVRSTTIHALHRLLEIRWTGIRNIQELLRIPIDQREPRALDLHHDAVTGAERVQHIRHPKLNLLRLARREWLGLGQALPEPVTAVKVCAAPPAELPEAGLTETLVGCAWTPAASRKRPARQPNSFARFGRKRKRTPAPAAGATT